MASREPLRSVEAVAAQLGLSYETVRRAIKAGELKGRKVGGVWRIAVEDVDAWLGA